MHYMAEKVRMYWNCVTKSHKGKPHYSGSFSTETRYGSW